MSHNECEPGAGAIPSPGDGTPRVVSHPRREAALRDKLASLQAVLATETRAAVAVIEITLSEIPAVQDEPVPGITGDLLSVLDDMCGALAALETDVLTVDPARFHAISARLSVLAHCYASRDGGGAVVEHCRRSR